MSTTGIPSFDSTLQKTNQWLAELMQELGWEDRHKAYHALRAVLHALRDRLPVNAAAHLAAQLPMLVRGIYYECWHPAGTPTQEYSQDEFLAHVTESFRNDPNTDSKAVTQAVFHVMARHVTEGEVAKVKRSLPKGIRQLWA